jgi:peroxiredoxin
LQFNAERKFMNLTLKNLSPFAFIITLVFAAQTLAQNGQGKYADVKLRVSINKTLPDIPLTSLTGSTTTLLQQLRSGQKTVVLVWATWCPACGRAIPALEKLLPEFQKAGVNIVGVSVDWEKNAPIKEFVTQKKVSFPIFDGGLNIARRLYAKNESPVPLFIMLDESGVISDLKLGWAEDAQRSVYGFAKIPFEPQHIQQQMILANQNPSQK